MTDRFDRNFLEEFRSKCRDMAKPQVINEPVEVPIEMQVPEGKTYSIFRRSNLGYNKKVFMNFPAKEASFWGAILNEREIQKRQKLKIPPDEVFFYEMVEDKSLAENPYWNPKNIVKG